MILRYSAFPVRSRRGRVDGEMGAHCGCEYVVITKQRTHQPMEIKSSIDSRGAPFWQTATRPRVAVRYGNCSNRGCYNEYKYISKHG